MEILDLDLLQSDFGSLCSISGGEGCNPEEKTIENVTNTPNATKNHFVNPLFVKSWFYDILKEALNQVIWPANVLNIQVLKQKTALNMVFTLDTNEVINIDATTVFELDPKLLEPIYDVDTFIEDKFRKPSVSFRNRIYKAFYGNKFLLVPKPSGNSEFEWSLDFLMVEKEILFDMEHLKPTLRLLKVFQLHVQCFISESLPLCFHKYFVLKDHYCFLVFTILGYVCLCSCPTNPQYAKF